MIHNWEINMNLKGNSTKTNHMKGIAAAKKAQKRAEAEERNKAYQALPLEEKLARNVEGGKVQKKLLAKVK